MPRSGSWLEAGRKLRDVSTGKESLRSDGVKLEQRDECHEKLEVVPRSLLRIKVTG